LKSTSGNPNDQAPKIFNERAVVELIRSAILEIGASLVKIKKFKIFLPQRQFFYLILPKEKAAVSMR
jgi:hypothetical protein